MRHRMGTLVAVIAVGALAAAAGCCPPGTIPTPPGEVKATDPLEASLLTLEGEETSLAAYGGKVVLVDFWASWCGPCRLAFPYYADIQARRGGEGFLVVAVSTDEDIELARSFSRRWALPFEILYDHARQGQAAFSVYQIPASFLLDRHGRLRFVHRGFDAERMGKLEEEVMFLLSER